MQNELVNKYLLNKQKTLLSYAVTLYKVYDLEDENLWSNEEEFKKLMDSILNKYMSKYYLRDKTYLKNLNTKNLSDKDFKMTLALAVISDHYGGEYNEIKSKFKKSIYNLTIILYIVTNADKQISFYNKYNVTTKNIVNLLNKLFSDVIGKIEIEKNPFIMEMLANKIKESEKKEIRFFESIKDNESYITFLEYSKNSYYVDYSYELRNLMKYDYEDVRYVYRNSKFKEQNMSIMYDLCAVSILKCYSNDCHVPEFIVPVSSTYIKLKTNIENIKRTFSNPYIKEKICFSTYFNDYKKNYNDYLKLNELGFKIVLFMDESQIIVDYSNVKYDFVYYVTEGFIDQNQKFMDFVSKGNVEYKVIGKINEYNEDELIQLSLKEEN